MILLFLAATALSAMVSAQTETTVAQDMATVELQMSIVIGLVIVAQATLEMAAAPRVAGFAVASGDGAALEMNTVVVANDQMAPYP